MSHWITQLRGNHIVLIVKLLYPCRLQENANDHLLYKLAQFCFQRSESSSQFLVISSHHFICITVISKKRVNPYCLCTVIHQADKIILIKSYRRNGLETCDNKRHQRSVNLNSKTMMDGKWILKKKSQKIE